MKFLEDAYYPYETFTITYNHTNRFIPYLYARSTNNLQMYYEFDLELDAEISMIKKGISCLKGYPKSDRNFDDLNIAIQSSLILCTRITNLHKIIFVLEKYDRNNRMVKKFKHILSVLRKEFYSLYNEEYNEKLFDTSNYKGIHGYDMSFVEYLIYKDLQLYFKSCKIDDYEFFSKNKRALYMYMAFVYMKIEYEFIGIDFDSEEKTAKMSCDFIKYYKITTSMSNELRILNTEICLYTTKIDTSNILDYITTHQLFVLKTE